MHLFFNRYISFFVFVFSKINFWTFFCILPLLFTFGIWQFTSLYIVLLFYLFFLNNFKGFFIYDKFAVFIYFVSGLIAYGNTPVNADSMPYFVGTIVMPMIIFVLISNINLSPVRTFIFINYLIFSGVILGIVSIYLSLSMGFFSLRLPSLWKDFNIVAAYFMIVFFFNLTLIIFDKRTPFKIFYLITIFFVFFGLFLTQTRGVWIGTLVAIFFYIIRRPKVFLPSLIIIGLFSVVFFAVVLDRFLSVKNFATDVSTLGRLHAWYISFLIIRDNWLWGTGFNSFIYLRDGIVSTLVVAVTHSHNTYLRLWLELGILGLVSTMYLMIKSFIYTFKSRRIKDSNKNYYLIDALQLSFVGLFVAFIFDTYLSLFGDSLKMIWVLIGLSYNIYNSGIAKQV